MLYYNVITGRGGLGNKLFPWARAVVYKKKIGGEIISPKWENVIKIGPYLRRENDKRHYFNVFNNKGYIKGLKKSMVLWTYDRLSEKRFKNVCNEISLKENYVIDIQKFVGEGISPYFEILEGHHKLIWNELENIINNNSNIFSENFTEKFIGVHIRMGEFCNSPKH